jgi:hypothetical protein
VSRERDYDLQRKRAKRASEAEITIPRCAKPARRKKCLADPELFLKTYFPDRFYYPFADHQKEIIAEICRMVHVGGNKAISAPRGDGKTEIVIGMMLYLILNKMITFAVVIAANGEMAENIYTEIRDQFETNELLYEDFPEVCHPIRELQGAPGRAGKQHVAGKRTRIEWKTKRFILPHVPGSRYGGVCMRWYGLDSAIRGVRIRGKRPDFVLLDDPETEESAQHDGQIKSRERILNRAVKGLAGQGKRITAVALCTIQNTRCLAARLTDRSIYPAWGGQRYAFVVTWPDKEAMALWQEYIHLRQEDQRADPPLEHGPNATAYLLENWEAMHRGAKMANEHRFISDPGPDGKPLEHSTLQHAFNFIADGGEDGWAAFAAEMQSDPLPDAEFEASGLNIDQVQRQLYAGVRGQYPADADHRVMAIDLGKLACHWVDVAWNNDPPAAGRVVHYGVAEAYPTDDDPTTIDRAILNCLLRWRDEVMALDPVPKYVLVDSGTFTDAAYAFVKRVGRPFLATKGQSAGQFRSQKQTDERIIGSNWNGIWQQQPQLWLYHLNVDHWKSWCHQRWLTPVRDNDGTWQAGSLSLPTPTAKREHQTFAKHICSEEEREEFKPGKGLRRFWHPLHANNHWLDAMAMACAAGSMLGVRLVSSLGDAEPEKPATPGAPAATKFTNQYGQPYLLTDR